MVRYRLEKDGTFIIRDYNQAKPWSSFFPGIAGCWGIPLWAFYVNRGQCIASVGIGSKDGAIMEFLPANKAYQLTPTQGFRTFLKIGTTGGGVFYEPFSPRRSLVDKAVAHELRIRPHSLTLTETHARMGLATQVEYFTLPQMPYAALVRTLTVRNTSKKKVLRLSGLDGLSVILPHGVSNWFLKEMGRTIEAWMTVDERHAGVPLFKLTTDPRDTAQVAFIRGANFYTSFEKGQRPGRRIVVDPRAVFGPLTDLSVPWVFARPGRFAFPGRQVAQNITPCAFTHFAWTLKPGQERRLISLVGHVFDAGDVARYRIKDIDEAFIAAKRRENARICGAILGRLLTVSGEPVFDRYAQQTYLDNILRGGFPVSLPADGGARSVYVYSRKHGDLERDYNRFLVAPTYFSHGDGNYRDVNQNRRCDVFFHPAVGDGNVRAFLNLIQLDGYNPLVLRGERFVIPQEKFLESPLASFLDDREAKKLASFLEEPFELGAVFRRLEEQGVALSRSYEEFATGLLGLAAPVTEATFGEGYWSDHWTYNTDLLESFFAVFPDRMRQLLFEDAAFTYFDTHVFVRPRTERYVVADGRVRQHHSLGEDKEKEEIIRRRRHARHCVRTRNGDGEVFRTTLAAKLVCLLLNKLATLDPAGVGVEMEAQKPNWYDALNGLPALFGSSVSETFEIKRLIVKFKEWAGACRVGPDHGVELPEEVARFFEALRDLLQAPLSVHDYWDRSHAAKETFRQAVRRGVSGQTLRKTWGDCLAFFDLALKKLDEGLGRARDPKGKGITTYFSYTVADYTTAVDADGRPVVSVRGFEQRRLPLFLEGFVHAMRTEGARAAAFYEAVKKGPLYDKKLKMYRVNASLKDESFELGRCKAFVPGWLENESVWLHMEYKFLLELLRNGLYDAFYKEMECALIPFQKPQVYGRSILENSSFIVSSVHADVSLHGQGFVARLSGSTAEFLHMWLLMNVGPRPFFTDASGALCLRLAPALHKRFFTKTGRRVPLGEGVFLDVPAGGFAFLFLGKTPVIYRNPKRKSTFGAAGARIRSISLVTDDGCVHHFAGDTIPDPHAALVRSGRAARIEAQLA